MPELPEVETVRKGLEQKLNNFYVSDTEVLTDRSIASKGGSIVFVQQLNNSLIGNWERKGKYLISCLYKKNKKNFSGWWVIHLRMTGHFQLHKKNSPPCKHTRVRIWDKDGNEIRFVDQRNFGQMWWVSPQSSPENEIKGLKELGPEPFSKEFNAEYLKKTFNGKKRPIKSTLLDQSIIAGTGNIYADESLFQAGIIPTKQSGLLKIQELKKLCTSLSNVMRISIGKGGTTFSDFRNLEGLNGNYGEQAWVYGREGKPCKKCGSTINKKKLAGRGTHWCPQCQR